MISKSLEFTMASYTSQSSSFNHRLHGFCMLLKYVFFFHKPRSYPARFWSQFIVWHEMLHFLIVIRTFSFEEVIFSPWTTIGNQQGWRYSHSAFCDRPNHILIQWIYRNRMFMTRITIE